MNWQELSFVLPGEISGAATELLESLECQAVSSEPVDSDDEFDLAEPTIRTWKHTRLIALFEENHNLSSIYESLLSIFSITKNDITYRLVEDQDWERAWLDGFKPIPINPNFWVCPSWCEIPTEAKTIITLDPGLAFGTGTHPTTFLCLQELAKKELHHKTLLDFGCGSGILAIGALKLGAQHAVATDIDPKAISATIDNATANDVSEHLQVINANDIEEMIQTESVQFDIVVANILADALIKLKPILLKALKPNGILLLSGILDHQAPSVYESFSEISLQTVQQDEWVALIGS